MNKNARLLEKLYDNYELIVNNDPNYTICLSSQRQLTIIDLKPNSLKVGQLFVYKIFEKYSSLLYYKLILLEWDKVKYQNLASYLWRPTK